ncbi:hypothetical protein [Streptomyces sp. NPDC046870]|uniref:alpha/beta fold hydrolase n=1 Tax=Streptomyces sp. NPDC046870 TaxID=3155135 RepID=UPI0034556404
MGCVTVGRENSESYESTAERLPGLIKDLMFVTVEGGPHDIAWTRPEEVGTALPEFLAK